MNAREYYQQLVAMVSALPAIVASNLTYREIDENECYIKGTLVFASGHELHIAEYIIVQTDAIMREKYRYQLLTIDSRQIVRWDNAAHHREIYTFPNHRHDANDTPHTSRPMSPTEAIADSLSLIERKSNS